jgi:flavorubredoxin
VALEKTSLKKRHKMGVPRQIKPNIYSVGAIDWDRRLFDELIPLPDGTSYNAYLVKGSEKTALIDTVDPEMEDVLIKNLDQLGVEKIDYVIANHAEQDHSGSLPRMLDIHPEAKVYCTPKCKDLLMMNRFLWMGWQMRFLKSTERKKSFKMSLTGFN